MRGEQQFDGRVVVITGGARGQGAVEGSYCNGHEFTVDGGLHG